MLPVMLAVLLALPTPTRGARDVCDIVDGSSIVANDGVFLGRLVNKLNAESVLNEFGTYGNSFNAKSIWNEFGKYGNKFSALSPFNEFSTTPPVLVKDGKAFAYLTVNKMLKPALNPYVLRSCEFN